MGHAPLRWLLTYMRNVLLHLLSPCQKQHRWLYPKRCLLIILNYAKEWVYNAAWTGLCVSILTNKQSMCQRWRQPIHHVLTRDKFQRHYRPPWHWKYQRYKHTSSEGLNVLMSLLDASNLGSLPWKLTRDREHALRYHFTRKHTCTSGSAV